MTIQNIEAEQALLGILMYHNEAYDFMRGSVSWEQFYEPFHQRLFFEIEDAINRTALADVITLVAKFEGDKAFLDLGGVRYFADLVDRSPPAANAKDYAALIRDCWTRRQVIEMSTNASALANHADRSSLEAISYIRQGLDLIESQAAVNEDTFLTATDVAASVVQRARANTAANTSRGRKTGLACFDQGANGLYPGDLIILGGKSGMGKTSLARNAAHGCAVHNPDMTVLFLGIEMGPDEMMQREISYLTKVHVDKPVTYQNIAKDDLTEFDLIAMEDALQYVPANLVMQDIITKPNLDDVRRAIWSIKRKRPIAAVFIDYLGLMQLPDIRGKNDAALWGVVTSGLKQIARQAKCAIVCLSQLSRASDARESNRPMLSDLRDSGAIEQDADVVMFAYREHYYLSRQGGPKGKQTKEDYQMTLVDKEFLMEAIVAKARRGPTKTFREYCDVAHDIIADENPNKWG